MDNEIDEVLELLRARKDSMRARMETHRTDLGLLRRWEALRQGERAILDVMHREGVVSDQPAPSKVSA